jgi:NAD(P)-dependent dehydrogenase (short-subunit alcohol dehydrogenase family)
MSQQNPQTVLITGASTGFGRDTAIELARKGHTVYASMRGVAAKNAEHAKHLTDLAANEKLTIRVVEIDVTNEAQINSAVESIISEAGRLDVVINNAGIFGAAITEAYTTDQFRTMFETNVFGAYAVTRAALPQLRAQRSGLIVNISSGLGRFTVPGMGLYASTKYALEAISESLRYELAPLGIDVTAVEPGAFKTEILGKGFEPAEPERAADYGELGNIGEQFGIGLGQYFESDAYRGPEAVVETIVDLVESDTRPARIPVGADMQPVRELNDLARPKAQALLEGFGMGAMTQLA